MLGRILCKIGLHKWQHLTFKFAAWTECARCEEVKDDEPVPRTFNWEKRGIDDGR